MFVGHYAASFVLKTVDKRVSLGLLFLAVQFVDILFFTFALFGIERFKIVEHFTQSTHFDLQYMPYTHSFAATLFWGLSVFVVAYLSTARFGNDRLKISVVLALAVMSHWFLDLLVHTPDLPLYSNDSLKLGFGLWNHAIATYILEAVLLTGSAIWYLYSTQSTAKLGKYAMVIFVLLMLIINGVNIFAPLDANATVVSVSLSALTAYFVFAIIAYWLDSKRV